MEARLGPTGLIQSMTTTGAAGVRAGTEVLIAQIQSQTKLRFGLYALATVFVVASALLVVFAPESKEVVSSIIAGALFVVAVGCAGFGTFAFKTPLVAAQAGTEPPQSATGGAPAVRPAPAAARAPAHAAERPGVSDAMRDPLAGAPPLAGARPPLKGAPPLDGKLALRGGAPRMEATMARPRAAPRAKEDDEARL